VIWIYPSVIFSFVEYIFNLNFSLWKDFNIKYLYLRYKNKLQSLLVIKYKKIKLVNIQFKLNKIMIL